MPGQRRNTKLLTVGEQAAIQRLLSLPPIGSRPSATQLGSPSSATQPVRSWAGERDSAIRADLVRDLAAALSRRLENDCREAERRAAMPVIDLHILESAGAAAKAAVNEVCSGWTDLAALTHADKERRRVHVFTASGPAPNLLDVTNPDARRNGGMPVDGREVAKHLASADEGCKKVMARYEFNPYTGTGYEKQCLSREVLDPFAKSNNHALEECDRLGYWLANPDRGLVFAPPYLDGWEPSDGYEVPVIWDRKFQAYIKLIHEYIHTLQHPLIPFATDTSHTIKEGVCEYLTTKVMAHLATKSVEEFNEIAALIQGSPADGRGEALGALVRRYQPGADYAPLVENVKQATVVMGGDNGLLAAFFQGHTEYIGRYFYGQWLDGARELAGGGRAMPRPIPDTFGTLEDLARASGLSIQTITADDPEVTPTGPLPAQIRLRGFHGHHMIVERNDDEAWEDWDMIAAQHDSDADLIRRINGNPASMPLTQWILVPDA